MSSPKTRKFKKVSNLLYLAINLKNSQYEQVFCSCFIIMVIIFVSLSPINLFIRGAILLCLLMMLCQMFISRQKQSRTQIQFFDTHWTIFNGNKVQRYHSARIICQLGWIMVIRFDTVRKSHLYVIYRDQISQIEHHQLCLLIQII